MEPTSQIQSTDVSYVVQGRSYTGYIADGSRGKPAPGILVIHEANGLARIGVRGRPWSNCSLKRLKAALSRLARK